jgi:putative redox protein
MIVTVYLVICKEKDMNEATVITRKIELTGELTGEQHDRLMQIADKCPIHKILSNPIKIETRV